MIIFADIHIHDHTLLETSLELLRDLVDMSNELKEHLYFVGDLIHKETYVPKVVANQIHRILLGLELPMIAISGNHDQLGYNYYDHPALTYLETIPNTILLDQFKYFDDPSGIRVHGIPYYHAPECFYRHLAQIEPNKTGKDILLIHQTPKGITNLSIPTQIDPESITGYMRVLSGHIHEYQRIGPNFTMLGNCCFVDSTDYDVPKHIFRFVDGKLKKIQSFFCENPNRERLEKVVKMKTESIIVHDEGKVDMSSTLKKYCEQEKLTENYQEIGLNLLK